MNAARRERGRSIGRAPGREPLKTRERGLAAALADAIARRIGQSRFQLWFEGHTAFHAEGDVLTVGVPNRHFEEWLDRNQFD